MPGANLANRVEPREEILAPCSGEFLFNRPPRHGERRVLFLDLRDVRVPVAKEKEQKC